jgi:hypothetical protein
MGPAGVCSFENVTQQRLLPDPAAEAHGKNNRV